MFGFLEIKLSVPFGGVCESNSAIGLGNHTGPQTRKFGVVVFALIICAVSHSVSAETVDHIEITSDWPQRISVPAKTRFVSSAFSIEKNSCSPNNDFFKSSFVEGLDDVVVNRGYYDSIGRLCAQRNARAENLITAIGKILREFEWRDDEINFHRHIGGWASSRVAPISGQKPRWGADPFITDKGNVLKRDVGVFIAQRGGENLAGRNSEPIGFVPGITGSNKRDKQYNKSPFLDPVWLIAVLCGCMGIYTAGVVSNKYGGIAFAFGALIMAAAFFVAVNSAAIFAHLAFPNCRSEDIRVQSVIIAELKLGDIERQILFADFGPDHATKRSCRNEAQLSEALRCPKAFPLLGSARQRGPVLALANFSMRNPR